MSLGLVLPLGQVWHVTKNIYCMDEKGQCIPHAADITNGTI